MSAREGRASPKMSSCFLWRVFFSLILYLTHPNIRMTCGCFVEEREALMDIRTSLIRANATAPRSWGRGNDCCSWERVKCSSNTRRVSHLYFSNLYDNAKVPTGAPMFWRFNTSIFSAFPELQFLDLSYNYASSLGFDGLAGLKLPKLQHLNLSLNHQLGESIFAALGELISLEVLDVSYNSIEGALPTAVLENLTNLRELNLSANKFNGSLPKSLLALPHLKILDLSENLLAGSIPISSTSEPVSLEVLDLSFNKMSGALPTEQVLDNLINLQELDLSFNQINGSLPKSLLALPRLKILDLSMNSLAGGIPISSSSEPVSQEVLNLSYNNMSGALTTEQAFQHLSNLRDLHLGDNRLSGNISTFLLSLPHLERLDLSYNLFEGPIPISPSSNISLSLRGLDFSYNNLSGRLSFFWLQNLTKLEEIGLSGNANLVVDVNIPGWVPPFQLIRLALAGSNLDRGFIAEPHFLRTQHHLRELDLSNNNLSGNIPNWLFTKEETLVILNLRNCSLTGSLSPIWHPQYALEYFDISTNHIVGKLPTNFSSIFPSMSFLHLSDNNFSGEIPMSLCHINNMINLDLSNNGFSGEMPACVFTDFPKLSLLSASNNQLGGLVLSGVKNLSVSFIMHLGSNKFEGTLPRNLSGTLEVMDFHDNKLCGELDTSFWNLSNLKVLDLAGNRITGNITHKVCSLEQIRILDLSDNGFTGSAPRCSSESLLSLNLSRNSLSGDISDDLLNTPNLMALDMRYNKFTGDLNWLQYFDNINILSLGWNEFDGQITQNLCKLKCLRIIDFSHNKLSGSLSPCVGNISSESYTTVQHPDSDYFYELMGFTFATKGEQYTYGYDFIDLMSGIDLSGNMLSGQIPWEIGNMSHIISLNLSYNLFTSQIPTSFAGMSRIESLDLSHNKLSGSIPSQLTRLCSLAVFSVAYNNLSGCIPNSGQFSSFTMDSYRGNSNLRAMSKGNICSPNSEEGDLPSEGSSSAPDDPMLYMISAASFVLAFWATAAFLFFHPLGWHVIVMSGKMASWYGD